jgi:Ca2+-binding EF-hand superfamily protein
MKQMFDKDGDGYLNNAEFCELLRSLQLEPIVVEDIPVTLRFDKQVLTFLEYSISLWFFSNS